MQERHAPVIVSTDTQISKIENGADLESELRAMPKGEEYSGYLGVALRVTFCRYTI